MNHPILWRKALALAALAVALVCALAGCTGALGESLSQSGQYRREVLRRINLEREAEGLEPLSMADSKLWAAAQKRAEELASSFSHTRPNGKAYHTVLDEYGVSCRYVGENIATWSATPAAVVEAWMNSPGHRANILSERYAFTKAGVGYVSSGGSVYWVLLLTDGS